MAASVPPNRLGTSKASPLKASLGVMTIVVGIVSGLLTLTVATGIASVLAL
jgi:hypothetical protein